MIRCTAYMSLLLCYNFIGRVSWTSKAIILGIYLSKICYSVLCTLDRLNNHSVDILYFNSETKSNLKQLSFNYTECLEVRLFRWKYQDTKVVLSLLNLDRTIYCIVMIVLWWFSQLKYIKSYINGCASHYIYIIQSKTQ